MAIQKDAKIGVVNGKKRLIAGGIIFDKEKLRKTIDKIEERVTAHDVAKKALEKDLKLKLSPTGKKYIKGMIKALGKRSSDKSADIVELEKLFDEIDDD